MIEWISYYLILAVIMVMPAKLICDKAGFPPRLSFVLLVPFAGYLILAFVLAFCPWPALEEGEAS